MIKACLKYRKRTFTFFATLLSGLFLFHQAQADGIRIYGQSAQGIGRAEAVVASGSDASAIWYNPALLPDLGGPQTTVGVNNLFIDAKYTPKTGKQEKSDATYIPLVAAYYAQHVGNDNLSLGLGINTPFGLATDWSKTSAFRYITTGGDISVINVNPTVAYRFSPMVSAGFGIDYYYSKAEIRQQYPWIAFTAPAVSADGSLKVDGAGDGWGFNVGVLLNPADRHSIGVTYRSQVVVDIDGGDYKVDNIPAAIQPLIGTGSSFTTGAKTSIRFPDIFSVGYAFKPSDRLVWEVGGTWVNQNDIKRLDIKLDRQLAPFFGDTGLVFDWKNSYTIRTGVDYQWTDNWGVSGGYFFSKAPINEGNFTPLIADVDHHVLTTGVRYQTGNFGLSVPMEFIFGSKTLDSNLTDATLTQNVDGDYDIFALGIALAVDYKFGSAN